MGCTAVPHGVILMQEKRVAQNGKVEQSHFTAPPWWKLSCGDVQLTADDVRPLDICFLLFGNIGHSNEVLKRRLVHILL